MQPQAGMPARRVIEQAEIGEDHGVGAERERRRRPPVPQRQSRAGARKGVDGDQHLGAALVGVSDRLAPFPRARSSGRENCARWSRREAAIDGMSAPASTATRKAAGVPAGQTSSSGAGDQLERVPRHCRRGSARRRSGARARPARAAPERFDRARSSGPKNAAISTARSISSSSMRVAQGEHRLGVAFDRPGRGRRTARRRRRRRAPGRAAPPAARRCARHRAGHRSRRSDLELRLARVAAAGRNTNGRSVGSIRKRLSAWSPSRCEQTPDGAAQGFAPAVRTASDSGRQRQRRSAARPRRGKQRDRCSLTTSSCANLQHAAGGRP